MAKEKMRALSIRQPYAELIMLGAKKIEYRSRVTHIRGQVYVYACKAMEPEECYEEEGLTSDELWHGYLVGTVEIAGCVKKGKRYEWQLSNPVRLAKPLRVTGIPQPGFFWPFGK